MPSKIDHDLIPPVIRESVDPEILARAQCIEWSINRDTGEDEHGFLGDRQDTFLGGYGLGGEEEASYKSRKIGWTDSASQGRDSGFGYSPTSPSLGKTSALSQQRADMSPIDTSTLDFSATNYTKNTGSMKRHPQGQYPFPIYKTNQEQLQGDVVFEVAPNAKPGEKTVHYERSSRVMNQEDLDALGLDPNFFGPNTHTTMDENEEETIESCVLKGGRRELEDLYKSMRTESGDYFDRQRARSVSPVGNRNPIESEHSEQRRTVIFGSVDEINREQEFYPYRDAHQGKPLPGDNEYGTWGSRLDEQKQWKLCDGQWVRVAEPGDKEPEPKYEKYAAERVKCKPSKKIQVVRAEPVIKVKPQGSTDSDSDLGDDVDIEPFEASNSQPDLDLASSYRLRTPHRRSTDLELELEPHRFRRQPLLAEPPVDIEALKEKYRPKSADKLDSVDDDTKPISESTGTILLEPITPPTEEIKVEPIQPTYVEMKKPLKHPEGEEEKLMEDPNLMWMRMGPAQYGPPFGTMNRRKAREEEWFGPPCELCHKQIEERRCMLAENMKFHCWHFTCSFCLKTLYPADFLINESDRKPYCLNCHKREFPEIPLANLKLEE